MKLDAYLKKHSISRRDFAALMGVSEVAVCRYVNSQRMPRRDNLEVIREITHGAVTPNDFLPSQIKKARACA